MDKESIEYLSKNINVTDEIQQKIENHAKMHGIKAEICAWYKDLDDFYSDWCSKNVGYTKREARELFYRGIGEFMYLPNNLGIVRFVI